MTKYAHNLQQLIRDLQKTPVVDQVKVNSIKQRIANGSYQVNAKKVADKFLLAEQLLS